MSVYTDGINSSEIRSVYTDENILLVYTDRIFNGLFFQTILPTE